MVCAESGKSAADRKAYYGQRALVDVLCFLEEYTSLLFGIGVHSSRVIRNARRIAESQGCDLTLYASLRAEILSVRDKVSGQVLTRVVPIPDLPVNFEWNSDLSALSWQALDRNLPLEEVRRRFDAITGKKSLSFPNVLFLISVANGAFCHLFGGDWVAVGVVVIATALGFWLRRLLVGRGLNPFLAVVACAFVSSMLASGSVLFPCTSQIAVATSVLYLVPGVPLLNGVIDVVEGHVVTGVSRLFKSLLLILCIGIGLAATLLIMQTSLL